MKPRFVIDFFVTWDSGAKINNVSRFIFSIDSMGPYDLGQLHACVWKGPSPFVVTFVLPKRTPDR